MNKVDEVIAKLEGITIVPCYVYGDTSYCTRELTGRVFKSKHDETTAFEACSYHLDSLLSEPRSFHELDL